LGKAQGADLTYTDPLEAIEWRHEDDQLLCRINRCNIVPFAIDRTLSDPIDRLFAWENSIGPEYDLGLAHAKLATTGFQLATKSLSGVWSWTVRLIEHMQEWDSDVNITSAKSISQGHARN
jgi:hypothetical protein